MKRLLIALMMMAATAHAGDIATLDNEAGGKIVFTDRPCPKDIGGLRMYATSRSGETLFGCWILPDDSQNIMVRYSDGVIRMYDPANIKFTDYFNRKNSDNKEKNL